MKNFTPHFSNTAGEATSFAKMICAISGTLKSKKIPRAVMVFMLLSTFGFKTFAATRYYTVATDIAAPTGGLTTVCQGTKNAAFTCTVTDCGTAVSGTGNTWTARWYFNGALVYTSGATASGASVTFTLPVNTFTYTTAGVFAGTAAGLTVGVSWSAGTSTCAGGATAGTIINSSNATTITVNAAPTGVTATASPNPVCVGNNLTLTGAATGATTYAWSGPGGTAISNPASLSTGVTSVVATNAGVYTLTATGGSCSTTAVTAALVVNSYPTGVTASATPNPVCQGHTLTLGGTATGATTYAWTGPTTGDIANTTLLNTSIVSTGLGDAGIYTLTASTPGCPVTVTTSAVTVNPSPTGVTATASPNPVCSGNNLTLTGGASGATSYAWTSPGGTAITSPGSLSTNVTGVVGGNAGIYTLTATVGSCSTQAVTTTVTVNYYPTGVTATASPNPICQQQTLTLAGTSAGAATYAWSGPTTGDIVSTTSLNTSITSVAAGDAGVYTLTASNPGCAVTVTTSAVTVNPIPTGITAAAAPNPVCVGNALTLTGGSTSAGGTTYAWTGPTTGDIASTTSLSTGITVAATGDAGVYTLTATLGSCSISAMSASVVVNSYPTGVTATASPNPACSGYPLTLTGTATGATTYAWSGPTTGDIASTSSLSTSIVSVAAGDAGVYTLTASTPGCAVTVTSSAVTVNATPSVPTALVNGTITTSSFATSWTASTGATSYSVYVYINSSLLTQAIGYTVTYGAGTSATINGLAAGTQYWYVVTGNTTTCSSVASTSQTVTTNEAACAGTPLAGVSTASPISGGAATPYTISLSGYSSATGLTFQWYSSPDGSTWSTIAGATNTTYSHTGVTANIYFECIVTCSGSGLSATSTACEVELMGCTPTTTSWLNAPIISNTYSVSGTPTWTVPTWVHNIYVDVQGAPGGGTGDGGVLGYQSAGGSGGRVQVIGTAGSITGISVTPGHVIGITVGGIGGNGGIGGSPGGGGADNYYSSFYPGAGGGGYSAVKDNTSATELVIAGGGGGGGGFEPGADAGGAGGGSSSGGVAGSGVSGACGVGGLGGKNAVYNNRQPACDYDGAGSNGASLTGATKLNCCYGAGGGGGGYFGGGSGSNGGGGGGGSSYSNNTYAIGLQTYTSGYNTLATGGLVIITYPLFYQDSIYGVNAFSVTGSAGTSLNDANMCAAAAPGTGYINRLSLSPMILYTGGVYPSSITWGIAAADQEAQVWIDFNNNGTFEASEEVSSVVGYGVSTDNPTTFNITIPSGAATGSHLMRVRGILEYSGGTIGLSTDLDPCDTQYNLTGPKYTAGDAADYTVYIENTPSLTAAPTSLNFGTIPTSSTSAAQTFSITASSLSPVVDSIIVTAPANYLVSTTGLGGSFASYVSVPYTGGSISSYPIYVEFVGPATSGTYSGNVTISGGGLASPVNVAVTGICAPPCTGTPTTGTASVLPYSGSGSTVFTLSLTGYSIGFGLTYQWQSSATGYSGWTNIPGATNPTYSFSGLAADTWYQCVLVCSFSTMTATSNTTEATYVSCTTTAASWTNATQTSTYNYSAAFPQTFTVPLNVTNVAIEAMGATGGASDAYGTASPGGAGGLVYGTLPVTPGEVLNIYVGSAGAAGTGAGLASAKGGVTTGGTKGEYGGGGGGASDIRVGGVALGNRVLVAAGGGGGAVNCLAGGNPGGFAGGLNGSAGANCGGFNPALCGQGGTQATFGLGATNGGVNGAAGSGGNSGNVYGGGGGGGYFGGGGGYFGGGGGGSSFASSALTGVTIDSDYNTAGNGVVILTYTPSTEITQYGVNTFSVTAATGANLSDAGMCAAAAPGTGYLSRVSLTPITLYPGGIYPSNVTWGIPLAHQEAQVWIDFNNDGIYQSTENVSAVVGYSATSTTNPTAFNITIPLSADTGAHLMRVRGIIENPAGSLVLSTNLDPCLDQYGGTGPLYNDGDEADYVVNIKCHVTAISGTPKVCSGSTTSLSDLTTGGTWTMVSSYASVGSTGIVSGVSAGTAVLTYSISNYCSTTEVITVNATPSTINGTLTVGTTFTTSLSDAVGGGTWSSTGDAAVVGTSGNATVTGGPVPGTSTVTYTIAGCTTTTIVTVTAVAIAPISGVKTICTSGTSILSDVSSGGTWSSSNTSIATVVGAGTTATVTAGTITGTATIFYTISGSSASVIVTVITTPASVTANATPNPICNGGTLSLNGAATGAASYAWTGPAGTGITSAGAINASVNGVVAGNAGVYTLAATNACGTTNATTNAVTVNQLPTTFTATVNPSPVCQGSSVTLSATSSGGTNVTYAWTGGTSVINNPTAINGTASITATALTDATAYTVTASAPGCTTSTAVTSLLAVNKLPTIFTATVNPNPVCQGNSITLAATSTGGSGVTYAWTGGTSVINNPTAINGTAGITATALTDATAYTVTASAPACATSTAVTGVLIVNELPTTFTATVNPNPVCQGSSITLAATSTGGSGVTYAWTGGTSIINNPTAINGTASITATALTDATAYTVTASAPGCTTSTAVTGILAVNKLPTTLAATVNPNPVCQSSSMGLAATSTGGSGVTYAWTGGTSVINNPTAINGTAGITATALTDATAYTVTASASGCGATTASTLVLTVTATAPTGVTAGATPNPLCSGGTLALNGTATGATGYSWTEPVGGTPIASPTSLSTSVNGVIAANAGVYTLSATNVCGTTTAQTSSVTLSGSLPTGVTASATPNPICNAGTLALNGAASGAVSYSWTGPGGTSITSAATINATVNNVVAGNAGVYTLSATNACGTVTAITNVVSVNQLPTAFTATVSPGTVCKGNSIALTTNASGGSGVTYAWTGGTSVINNPTAINGTASITATALTDATAYTLTATAPGCGTSTAATNVLTVNGLPTTFTATVNPNPVCQGNSITLTATSAGGNGVTYAWTGGTSVINNPTAINGTAGITGTAPTDATAYTVTASAPGCATSTAVTAILTVNELPTTFTATVNPNPVCQGSSITLAATSTGGSGVTYAWTGGTSAINNPTAINGTAGITATALTDATAYTVTASAPGCSTSTAVTSVLTVNKLPTTFTATVNPNPVCQGNSVTLSATSVGGTGVTYAWTGGTSLINNSTAINGTASITATALTDATAYTVTASAPGCATSTAVTGVLAVNKLPTTFTATVNPNPICQGSSVTFAATSAGGNGVTYAWTGGTSVINNSTAINGTAGITATALTDATAYTVTASAPGCATSTAVTAVLTVNALPTISATVNPNPVCQGSSITLSATSTGGGGVTYAWTGGTSVINNPTAINGTAGITAAALTDATAYTLTATAPGCSATTAVTSVLAVNKLPTTFTATVNPKPVCQGSSITLAATSAGGSGVTYAWTGGASVINNPTAINGTAGITATALTDATAYTVTASAPGCSTATAVTGVLTVNKLPTTFTATVNPNPVCQGNSVTLAATSTGGSGVTYAWTGGTSVINNSTAINGTASITATALTDATAYTVTASAPGCATSTAVTGVLAVNKLPTTFTATVNPNPICQGSSVSFVATSAGGSGVTYAWTGGTSVIHNPTAINGTASITATALTDATAYTVTASAPGCATSTAVTSVLTVNALPTITASVNPNPVCQGSSITLSATSTGGGGVTYAWTGGTSVINNPTAINGTAGITAVALTDATAYTLTATAPGCPTSTAVTSVLAVNKLPTTLTATVNPNPVCQGSSVTLAATSAGGSGVSYAWTGGTSVINNPTAINGTAGITATALTDATAYTVTATAPGCSTSTAVTGVLAVNKLPTTFTASVNPNPVCQGSSITLAATSAGGSGVTYAWTGGTSVINNPTAINGTAGITATALTDATAYTVTASAPGCATSTAVTGILAVNKLPTTFTATVNPNPVCQGSSITLAATSAGGSGVTYAWTGGTSVINNPTAINGTAGITATALTDATAYTVTASAPGCSTSTAVTGVLTVNKLPTTFTASVNPNPVCQGNSITLSATSTGGAGVIYAWTGGTSVINNPTFINGAAGISSAALTDATAYTVTASAPGCATSTAVTGVLAVNKLPTTFTATVNPNPVCQGSSIILAATSAGGSGVTYAWTGGTSVINNPAAINGTASITATALTDATAYTVTASAAGCVGNVQAITGVLAVNKLPASLTATVNPNPVCQGSSITLSATSAGGNGVTYAWTGGTSTINNPTAINGTAGITATAPTDATAYTVTASAAGCAGNTRAATSALVVTPSIPTGLAANAIPNPICTGGTLALNGSAVGAASYSWSGPGGTAITTPTSANASVNGVIVGNAGVYTLAATNVCGTATMATSIVTINTVPTSVTASANSVLCVTGTLTLTGTANGAATYSWAGPGGTPITSPTSPNASVNGVVAGNAGVYTFSATNTCGTSTATTSAVTVHATPTATPSNNSFICNGGTVTLSSVVTGGTVANYIWNGPSILTGANASTATAAPTVIGTNTYTLSVNDGTGNSGCSSQNTTIVTVNATPSANPTNNGYICNGGTVTILANPANGASVFTWNGPSILSGLGTATVVATPTVTGVYSLTVSDGSGHSGCSPSMQYTTTVTVDPTPGISSIYNTGYICNGGTVSLVAIPSTFLYPTAYAWTGPNLLSNTGENPMATPTANSTYTVTVSDGSSQSGCSPSTQYTTTVDVHITPSADPTSNSPICIGGTVSLVANETYNVIDYTWTGSNLSSSTIADPTATPTSSTIYTLVVSDGSAQSGCSPATQYTTAVTVNGVPSVSVTNNGPVCADMQLTLTASGASNVTGYSWSGPVAITNSTLPIASVANAQTNATGTYTVTVNNGIGSGCTASFTTQATVNALPNQYNVTGGGPYCAGGLGVPVGLSGSDTGITYYLYNDGSPFGSLLGSGSPLNYGDMTIGGTYSVLATNNITGCNNNMLDTAVVIVNPLPNPYVVLSSGTNYCYGHTGIDVSLSGSDLGIRYQLYIGSAPIGASVNGNTDTISFGVQTIAGDYFAIATDTTTGCTNYMTGAAEIIVDSLPTIYNVSSGGAYCAGSAGIDITLSGSQTGVTYKLMNSILGVVPMPGTGSLLNYGDQTDTGTYSIVATNNTTACASVMNGNPVIVMNALPAIDTVTGSGTYCQGTSGDSVDVNGSTTGINYRLYNGATLVDTVMGTGAAFSFGAQPAGVYTVTAFNATTGCTAGMYGVAAVTMNPAPSAYGITGIANYCANTAGVNIMLGGSNTGITYTLYNGATPDSAMAGTGSTLNFGTYTAGNYSIIASNNTTLCTSIMTGGGLVGVNAIPVAYDVTGGGPYCAGSGGSVVGVGSSDAGVKYFLYDGSSLVDSMLSGTTGTPVNFGQQAAAGTYTVNAMNESTGCTNNMTDSVVVTVVTPVTPSLTVTTGMGDTVCLGNTITFTANPVNGGSTPIYQWYLNTVLIADATNIYSHVPANGDVVKAVLISSAACSSPDTVSASDTMTVETQTTPSVSIAVNPGTLVCSGTAVTFTAASAYGGSLPILSWSVNGVPSATGTTYTYMPANGDNVSVELTSNFTCAIVDTAVANVMMNVGTPSIPVVEISANPGTSIATGQVDTLTASVTNAGSSVSYQWVVNSTVVVGATNAVYSSTFNNNDSVTCQAINYNGCNLEGFNSVKITVFPLDIKAVTFGSGDIRLIPNPNQGNFEIKGTLGTTADEEVTMEVTDILGQVVYKNKVMVHNGLINENVQLSSTLANGMYMMNLRSGSDSKVIHFVIEQ